MKEPLSPHEPYILEAAALTHDLGIKKAKELYEKSSGALQEQLGPDIAAEMLASFILQAGEISRVRYFDSASSL